MLGDPRAARRGAPLFGAAVDARGGAGVDPGPPGADPAAARRRRRPAAGGRAVPADRRRPLAAARRPRGGAGLDGRGRRRLRRAGAVAARRSSAPTAACSPTCSKWSPRCRPNSSGPVLALADRRPEPGASPPASSCSTACASPRAAGRSATGRSGGRRPIRRSCSGRLRVGAQRPAWRCPAAACSGRSSSATARVVPRASTPPAPPGTIRRRSSAGWLVARIWIAAPAEQPIRYEQALFASRWLAGADADAGGAPSRPSCAAMRATRSSCASSIAWTSTTSRRLAALVQPRRRRWRRPPPTGAATRRWCAGRARSSSSITWRASARIERDELHRALDALAGAGCRRRVARHARAGPAGRARRRRGRRRSAGASRSRTRWWRG